MKFWKTVGFAILSSFFLLSCSSPLIGTALQTWLQSDSSFFFLADSCFKECDAFVPPSCLPSCNSTATNEADCTACITSQPEEIKNAKEKVENCWDGCSSKKKQKKRSTS